MLISAPWIPCSAVDRTPCSTLAADNKVQTVQLSIEKESANARMGAGMCYIGYYDRPTNQPTEDAYEGSYGGYTSNKKAINKYISNSLSDKKQ